MSKNKEPDLSGFDVLLCDTSQSSDIQDVCPEFEPVLASLWMLNNLERTVEAEMAGVATALHPSNARLNDTDIETTAIFLWTRCRCIDFYA